METIVSPVVHSTTRKLLISAPRAPLWATIHRPTQNAVPLRHSLREYVNTPNDFGLSTVVVTVVY